MHNLSRILNLAIVAAVVAYVGLSIHGRFGLPQPGQRDINEIRARISPLLDEELTAKGLRLGAPLYIRIFKEERALEVWIEANQKFELFRSYQICNFSGDLGPKLKEGDRQSPEGFYYVTPAEMNPNSSFHLSFNLGFPNAFDRHHDRTGSFLMVHGACASIGCYAMTNVGIEEIYIIAEAALSAGQGHFKVHAFPFRMTEARLSTEVGNRWHPFWRNLKDGYDAFESGKRPPETDVSGGRYVFINA